MEIPTKARYLHLTGKVFTREDGLPFMGDFVEDEVIFRCRGDHGLLHCENEFAIFAWDHYEYWKDGKLHRENGPAVVSVFGEYKEYWINGMKLDMGSVQKSCHGEPDRLKIIENRGDTLIEPERRH